MKNKTLWHLRYGAAALFLVLAAGLRAAEADCDRQCLTSHVDSWFEALQRGSADGLPLGDEVRITLNGRRVDAADTLWPAREVQYRWDIVNERLGDTGTEAVVRNADGSQTMLALRLKVLDGLIREMEIVRADEGDAGFLWGPERLVSHPLSPDLQLSLREADQDSYYGLIAAAESYWRAFQTNGTEAYHPADLLPDARRFENGLQTTGIMPDGSFRSAIEGFDQGAFIGRNLWDRRYPVVDTERGIVMSMVRFGLKDGMESQSAATSNDRLVAEFFTVKGGMIQEIHAVLYNLPDSEPSGWEPEYGPGRGGW